MVVFLLHFSIYHKIGSLLFVYIKFSVYFYFLAYADESTEVKEIQANLSNSRSIQKTVSTAVLDKYDSRTGPGVDRSIRTGINRCNDSHHKNQDVANGHPNTIFQVLNNKFSSSEAANIECSSHIWREPDERLLARSCSMPVFNTVLRGVTKTTGSTFDKELFHLTSYAKMRHFDASPLDNFKNGRFPQSPFVSPLLADDNLLKGLCPVHLMVSSSIQLAAFLAVFYMELLQKQVWYSQYDNK